MAHPSRHAGTEHNCRRPWRTHSLSSQITSYCSLMSIKLHSWRTSASVKKPNVTPVTCTVVTSLDTCALMLLPAALYLPSHHLLHARLLRMSACTAGGWLALHAEGSTGCSNSVHSEVAHSQKCIYTVHKAACKLL